MWDTISDQRKGYSQYFVRSITFAVTRVRWTVEIIRE